MSSQTNPEMNEFIFPSVEYNVTLEKKNKSGQ